MRRKTVLRNFDAMDEAGRHHPPADRALQRAEAKNQPKPCPQSGTDPAAPEEPQQRQQEHHADGAADEAVRPFPPIDRLERVEAHAVVKFAILRNGLIFFELGLPLGVVKRRYYAHDGLPLGDRQTGFGQPRRTTDQNHGKDQRGNGIKPEPDRVCLV